MSVVVDGSNGLVFNDATTQTTAASGFGFKNRIINGAMNIWQRGTNFPQTGLSFGSVYLADRFYIESTNSTAAATWSQVQDAPAGFTYSLKQTVTATQAAPTATGHYYGLCQQIEGYNFADLAYGTAQAASAVLSFWVKSSVTGTFSASFILTGGTPGEKTYPFTYTIAASNTWTQVIINIPGNTSTAPTSVTIGAAARVEFYTLLSAGYATGTAGTWNTNASANQYASTQGVNLFATSGATWQITGVQFEKGSTATAFDYRPYSAELQLCQRYFIKSFEPGTAPANGAAAGINGTFTAYNATNSYGIVLTYPVQMRSVPTVAFYGVNGATGVWDVYKGAGWGASTSTTVNSPSSTCLSVFIGSTGMTAWASYLLSGNYTANAEL